MIDIGLKDSVFRVPGLTASMFTVFRKESAQGCYGSTFRGQGLGL